MDLRLVVWNPCLGETTWIKLKTGYREYTRFFLGYQKNKACHSYKILRWNDGVTGVGKFEIYEFCSNSWRVLNDDPKCLVEHVFDGVTLKGNTYWIAEDDKTYKQLLVCFDFTAERFKPLSLPKVYSILAISVVGEEQLLLVDQTPDLLKMQMCVTKKIDTHVSWSICFTVDIHSVNNFPTVNTSLLIDEEKKVTLCSIINDKDDIAIIGEDDKYYIEIANGDDIEIFHYVPSLVQVQQNRDRIKE